MKQKTTISLMALHFNVLILTIVLFLAPALALANNPSSDSETMPEVEVPVFTISEYRVEGNTLVSQDKIKSVLKPFTGSGKDFGTVQQAMEALEKIYRDQGYAMVVVVLPEQELEQGVIRLNVYENRLGKINIEGNRYFDEANIRRSLPGLHHGEPLNFNVLSRSLKMANENPSKKINLQMMNSTKEDEMDANIVVVDEKIWKVGLSADNTGDKRTGRSRMGAIFQHTNLFNRDQLLTLQYITSPENLKDVNIYSLGYRIPIYALGSSIDFIGAYSDVDSGSISAASYNMNVSGKGSILGLRYNQNLARLGNYEHKIILGLDYRAYENDVSLLDIPIGNNVTVHPLTLTYSGSWTWANKLNAGFYLTGLQNLPGNWDGRDEPENFAAARFSAPRGYNILRYGGNLLFSIGADWQARMLLNGQYTNDQLVPGEQFGIGGASSVRGYQEREFSNDKGYAGSFEIYTPDLTKLIGFSKVQTRLLVFYDRGYISRKDPLPGESGSTGIASFGPGLRITDGKRISISADCGFAIDPLDGTTDRWSNIWHLSATILF